MTPPLNNKLKKELNSFTMKVHCAQEVHRHFLFGSDIIRNDEMQQIANKDLRFG
jgi:hypothetical protein